MPMNADAVSKNVFVHIREMELGRRIFPAARYTSYRIYDDLVSFNQTFFQQAREGLKGKGVNSHFA